MRNCFTVQVGFFSCAKFTKSFVKIYVLDLKTYFLRVIGCPTHGHGSIIKIIWGVRPTATSALSNEA